MSDAASNGGGGGSSLPATPSNFRANINRGATTSVPSGNGSGGSTGSAQPTVSRGVRPSESTSDQSGAAPIERARIGGVQRASELAQDDDAPLIPDAEPDDGDYEPEPEIEASDDSEPSEEIDPWEAELYGMKTRELVELLKSSNGLVPQALLEKLAAEVEIDGMKRKIGLHELPKHVMRQNDYSRHMADLKRQQTEAAQIRDQYIARNKQVNQMFDSWLKGNEGKVDPKAFRRDMRRMGMGQVFVEAAEAYGNELRNAWHDNEEIRSLRWNELKRREAEEDREWQEQQRRARIEQEDRQRNLQRLTHEHTERLKEYVPAAYEAHGLQDTKTTADMFQRTLYALWDQNKPVTRELINEVCASMKLELEDMARRYELELKGAPAANDNGKPAVAAPTKQSPAAQVGQRPQLPNPLGPQRIAGASSGAAKKNGALPARPSNFRAHLQQKRR